MCSSVLIRLYGISSDIWKWLICSSNIPRYNQIGMCVHSRGVFWLNGKDCL